MKYIEKMIGGIIPTTINNKKIIWIKPKENNGKGDKLEFWWYK